MSPGEVYLDEGKMWVLKNYSLEVCKLVGYVDCGGGTWLLMGVGAGWLLGGRHCCFCIKERMYVVFGMIAVTLILTLGVL